MIEASVSSHEKTLSRRLVLGLCFLFLMGLVIGGASTMVFVQYRFRRIVDGGPPAIRELVLKRLRHELDVTPSQEAEVNRIVVNAHMNILRERLKIQPEIERTINDAKAELARYLDETQNQKLDRLYQRQMGRFYRSAKILHEAAGASTDTPAPTETAGQSKKD